MARSRCDATGSEGFTLLEILVALAILGFAFAAVLRAFGSGLEQARLAEAATLRVLEAQSVVDAVVAGPELSQGERAGTLVDGSTWRLVVAPIEGDGDADPPTRAYSVVFAASNGNREVLTLRTFAVER